MKACIFLGLLLLTPFMLAQEWIDVSVPVHPDTTPVYSGDAPPKFVWLQSMDKGDGLNLSELHMGAHTGTHVDAPLHFIQGADAVDKLPLGKFIGPGMVIECSPSAEIIDAAELNRHKWRGAKRIFFKTRSSYQDFWKDKEFHKDFVAFAPDAAKLLADGGVELVGIDYLSAEKFGAPEPLAHRALLGKGVGIIEGLDLRKVKAGEYDIIALPMMLVGREGAPARVVIRPR